MSTKPSALDRIHRTRTITTCSFGGMTAVMTGAGMLREAGEIPPSAWGFILMLWTLSGITVIVVRCTAYLAAREHQRMKRVRCIEQKIDMLMDAAKVAGWSAAMEEDTNVRHITRR